MKKNIKLRGFNSWGFDSRVKFSSQKQQNPQIKDKVVDSGKVVKTDSDTFIELNVKNSDEKVKIDVTQLAADKASADITPATNEEITNLIS